MKTMSAAVLICSLVLITLPSAGLAQSKSEGIRLFKEATEIRKKAKSKSDLTRAVNKYQRALKIFERVGFNKGVGVTANNLGMVYSDLGQNKKAVELYEKSLAINRKARDVRGEGKDLNNLGIVFAEWGQYKKAMEFYKKSLAIKRKLGDVRGEGSTLNNLGTVYCHWGQYEKAVEFFEKCLSIERKLGDVRGEGRRLNNLGLVYSRWGQYNKAVEFYEKSLVIFRKLGDVRGEGPTLNNLGLVYRNRGQYNKAVEFYEKSLAIFRKLGDVRNEGNTLNNLGLVFQHRGEPAKALAHFRQGLAIWKNIGVPTHRPENLIADVYLDRKDLSKAREIVHRAGYDSVRGRYFLLSSKYDEARDRYEDLRKNAEKNRNAENLFLAYTGLGKAYEGLEDYKKAEEYYEKGLRVVEDTRSSIGAAQRKNFLSVKVWGFYRSEPAKGLARVRMKMNPGIQRIDSLEVTRARGFADRIALRSSDSAKDVPKLVLEEEENLVSRVAALKGARNKTARDKNPEKYDNLTRQITDAEQQLNRFIEKLRKKHPAYAAVKYAKTVGPKESALKPDECAVILDVSEEGVIVKVIRDKKIVDTNFKSWKRTELETAVRRFREPLEKADKTKFDPKLAHSLFKGLLARALMDVPHGTPLILMPDGILATLPFEALVVSGEAQWKKSDHGAVPSGVTYLGDLYPISYYQSVTALTFARTFRKPGKQARRTLVMADPVFEPTDERFRRLNVAKRARLLAHLPDRLMSIQKETGLTFPRLPLTEKLGTSLLRLDPKRTDLFIGLKAEKALLFKRPLTDYRYLVFATHGYFGNNIPRIQEPVLALTLVNQPDESYGLLRMTEVMGLKLNADLVALTACQTGLGKNLAGEGVMSMGRAFQYAGAQSVLMSLWPVAEEASVTLVESFFKHLKDGKNKLEALRLARKEIREAGYDHPFYWAPFILVGEVN